MYKAVRGLWSMVFVCQVQKGVVVAWMHLGIVMEAAERGHCLTLLGR
jgi:metallophosphoesterase superfamily enzyme